MILLVISASGDPLVYWISACLDFPSCLHPFRYSSTSNLQSDQDPVLHTTHQYPCRPLMALSPRILFLDAYDSFSNNIIALLRISLSAEVDVLKIDDPRYSTSDPQSFYTHLTTHGYDAIVAGPGPGDPRNPADIGLISALWSLCSDDDPSTPRIAVLGICLGFQSLVLAFGGHVSRLSEPRHGFTTPITHSSSSIFTGLEGEVHGTQYHSLHAHLSPDSKVPSTTTDLWHSSSTTPDLIPLAYDLSDPVNGAVLMSVKHAQRPFWGLQYHPESICTNPSGQEVVRNWWSEAQKWLAMYRGPNGLQPGLDDSSSISKSGGGGCKTINGNHNRDILPGPDPSESRPETTRLDEPGKVLWTCFEMDRSTIDVARITALFRSSSPSSSTSSSFESGTEDDSARHPMLLESGTKDGKSVRPETGRFSIIALPDGEFSLKYWTGDHKLQVRDSKCNHQDLNVNGGQQQKTHDKPSMSNVMHILKTRQTSTRARDGPETPFWGGMVGYLSYEAGLATIQVQPPLANHGLPSPDVWFISVSRSVVVDHAEAKVYVQTLANDDLAWLATTKTRIQSLGGKEGSSQPREELSEMLAKRIYAPDRAAYLAQVRECQSHIRAGSSYELCLTDQTVFSSTSHPDPWQIYRRLRVSNPAPFGAYVHFCDSEPGSELTLLSSSPERFMTWSRAGACQFRPIKGTVKKSPGMTRARAEAILQSRKERAENLMIVDLIRHDLHGVIRTSARVSKLMEIEEYETVYQLVSVIEGDLSQEQSGIDVLAASLPPGSMTGAPKKRSCELLTEIEGHRRRGLYSGLFGFLDAGGGGDFSVVIRSMVKYGDEWRIGAGGAVTALSVPADEYDEMRTKCDAVLAQWEFKSCS